MPYFDRFDICEAHRAIEIQYNVGGWLHERPSNRRRHEATHVQLHRAYITHLGERITILIEGV